MPALVNIRVGSFLFTMGAEGTILCCFEIKKSRNVRLICCAVMVCYFAELGLVRCSAVIISSVNCYKRFHFLGALFEDFRSCCAEVHCKCANLVYKKNSVKHGQTKV